MDKRLIDAMTVYLANNTMLWYKASNYHWNLEGQDFFQYHLLFEKIYNDVYDQIDTIAEKIRQLHGYVISCPLKLLDLSTIKDCGRPSAIEMVKILEDDQKIIQNIIMDTFNVAKEFNDQGDMNYLASRLEAHKKWEWMLRATTKA